MKGFINHMNLAVIKNQLIIMDEEEVEEVIRYIEMYVSNLSPGVLRNKHVQLYGWCRNKFPSQFKKEKPSLF